MKKSIIILAVVLGSFAAVIHIGYANAQPLQFASASQAQACNGLNNITGQNCSDTVTGQGGQAGSLVSTAIDLLSKIVGFVALIMIIYAGFRYMTAGGDAGKIALARNTVVYAAIGLVIAALAQVFINVIATSVNKL